MNTHPVSVLLPLNQAFERVRQVLFQPFDPGKWFVIGFCAWLAFLGEGGGSGGGGGNFNVPGGRHDGRDFHHEFEQAKEFLVNNLYWIVPLVAALILFIVILSLIFTWLSSRGKFMFLHCVALNRADVVAPWNQYSRAGNSLFLFRVVLGLLTLALILPLLAFGGLLIFRMALRSSWTVQGIMGLVGIVLLAIFLGILLGLVRKFTMDFVVPIMYLRGRRCLEGWSELGRLMTANVGHFVLYLLFQLVLNLCIGILVFAVVILTCCLAGCLLAIPYLGTVLFLPVLVFQRSYSLYYLAQYGREYDVFTPATTPS